MADDTRMIRFGDWDEYESTRLFDSSGEVFKAVVLWNEQLSVDGRDVSRASSDRPFGAELLQGPG